MTRFWITLEQAVKFVIKNFERMKGGEIFIPKIPSMKVIDLAKAIAPECEIRYIGIRPGEKLHEVMISPDDSRNTIEFNDCYILKPDFEWWDSKHHSGGNFVSEGFSYASNTNPDVLNIEQMKELIKDLK